MFPEPLAKNCGLAELQRCGRMGGQGSQRAVVCEGRLQFHHLFHPPVLFAKGYFSWWLDRVHIFAALILA